MTTGARAPGTAGGSDGAKDPEDRVKVGAALRRAWVGYQRRLDEEMKKAGFADRSFPDGRVLRLCSGPEGTTISHIGRELGITRQGASKIVAALHDRRYVTLGASVTDGREKIVKLTPRAVDYLATQRRAARTIESQLRRQLGPDALLSLFRLADALGGDDDPRMSDYLRQKGRIAGFSPFDR
jgi:DNA-binding MarR family transcriptional regulator